MEENEKYTTGFNHGYLLQQFRPETLEWFKMIKDDNDYIKGLWAGKAKLEKDKALENKTIEKLESKQKNKDNTITKDR